MRNQRGFTLIELLVVVAIIGILSAIAIPAYGDYVLRGKLSEAFSQLSSLQLRMEQYYQDNRSYDGGTGVCGIPAPTGTTNFTYACTTTGQAFTYTATGVAGVGVDGFVYTINDAGTKATTTSGTAAAKGWPSNASCWVRSKGGC